VSQLDISLVPYGMLTRTLAGLGDYLEKAALLTDGRSAVDDIVRMIMLGQYNLWVVFEKESNDVYGFFTTEIKHYPQMKMLCAQHVVIDPQHMDELECRVEDLGIEFAKSVGCAGIEFVGRPGWRKYSKANGYASYAITYQKIFEVKELT